MSGSTSKTPGVVFRLGHMGDVALTTGVLARWHETSGDTFIFITRESNAPLLENHPAITNIVGLSPEELRSWFATAGKLAGRFRNHPLIDLHGILRSRILALRWKGEVKRYPKFGLTRRLYDRTRLDAFRKKLETTTVPQRYAMALEAEPPPARAVVPRIFLTDAEQADAAARLSPIHDHGPLVALHPYATHPAKEWPREHWTALIYRLEKEGINWFVVGRNETRLMEGDEHDLTNSTDLRRTCGLLERADLLVTGDSGPMHLACGVSTPVVALFGPTSKAWGFYPAGPEDLVLERALDCRPCSLHGAKPCDREFDCMASITPDTVMETVRRKLAG